MKKESCECTNSFGIASVILGLVGTIFGVLVLPIILSIVGLVFGILQYKRNKNAWATWGIILSIIGIIISLLLLWQIFSAAAQFQQVIETCRSNPALEGCSDLLKLTGNV